MPQDTFDDKSTLHVDPDLGSHMVSLGLATMSLIRLRQK